MSKEPHSCGLFRANLKEIGTIRGKGLADQRHGPLEGSDGRVIGGDLQAYSTPCSPFSTMVFQLRLLSLNRFRASLSPLNRG